MIVISKIKDVDVSKVAELSYMVGKMHDEEMPNYFNKTTFDEHFNIIKKMKDDDNAMVMVAKVGEEVVGFICLGIIEDKRLGYKVNKIGVVYNLGVDEKFRGRGIGKKLIKEGECYFKKNGCEVVDLNVYCFNKGAINFYKNLGYEVIDINMRKGL